MAGPNEYLAEGWCRGADGALRRETVHSMLRRLPGWNYRQRAIYQITITLADRASRSLGRLAVKRLFPDLFRVVGELKLPLDWGDGRRLVGHFMALGNRFLLARSLVQVQVSRRDFGYRREAKAGGGLKIVRDAQGVPEVAFSSPAFDEKRELLLEAARHGAVLISPCVSDGEREIARLALAAERPLVTLQNKGFAPMQKPGGRYFDACADGRLLMLAPIAWPYQPGDKPMTRFDATAMNRLCQGLVGEDAAPINYHGMKPADIDSLAWAAARLEEMK